MVMAATAAAASSSSSSSGISGIVAGTMGEAEPVLDLGAGVEAGLGLGDTMSRFMPINYRELSAFIQIAFTKYMLMVVFTLLALLYIHRCFFAHAISTHPSDPIKSQYAPSFLAGYRSACTILGSVRQQFWLFPRQIARFWVLWTHAFSATVSAYASFFFFQPLFVSSDAVFHYSKTLFDIASHLSVSHSSFYPPPPPLLTFFPHLSSIFVPAIYCYALEAAVGVGTKQQTNFLLAKITCGRSTI